MLTDTLDHPRTADPSDPPAAPPPPPMAEPEAIAPTMRTPQVPRTFAGYRVTHILLVAVIGGLLAWNAWMTREIMTLRHHRIVSVSLASIITDFVHDQSRQQGSPEEAAMRTRLYLAATQKALVDLAKDGTPVVASEAVLGNSVPDDTAKVKAAVAKALAAPAEPH